MSELPQRAELPVLGSHGAGVLTPPSGPVLVVEDGGAAIVIRRAVASDVGAMHALQADFVAARILLARDVEQIRASIDAYVVAADGERIVGTGMLKVYSPDLAEICALAVDPAYQAHGLGRGIVAAGNFHVAGWKDGVRDTQGRSESGHRRPCDGEDHRHAAGWGGL